MNVMDFDSREENGRTVTPRKFEMWHRVALLYNLEDRGGDI